MNQEQDIANKREDKIEVDSDQCRTHLEQNLTSTIIGCIGIIVAVALLPDTAQAATFEVVQSMRQQYT
jgi:hypothetical protein